MVNVLKRVGGTQGLRLRSGYLQAMGRKVSESFRRLQGGALGRPAVDGATGVARKFIWISLLTGIVLTALGTFGTALVLNRVVKNSFERATLTESNQDGTHIAQIFYYTVWAPIHDSMPDLSFSEAVYPAMMDVFAKRSTFGLGVVGLKVWGADGALLWSSDSGASAASRDAAEWSVAAGGQPDSRVYWNARITDLSGQQRRMDVVRTYVPVLDTAPDSGAKGSLMGILEITRDVSDGWVAARGLVWAGTGLVAVLGFGLLALMMLVMVRSGTRVDARFRRLARQRQRVEKTRAQQEHSARLAVVGELVASVAHEINNPLTAIWGLSQVSLKREMDGKLRQSLEMINTEANRSVRIVQNLLSFSRARAAEKAYVSINAAIDAALELRRYNLMVNNIALDLHLDPCLPWTMADPHKIQQVALNLITNAEQAMTEEGHGGRLTVATERDGDWIEFRVRDTGPGIAPDAVDKIFDPFFTTKGDGKGTGLGLSVSYSIVEEHDGSIDVKSEPGKGTEFSIRLPIVCGPESEQYEEDGPDFGRKSGGRKRQRLATTPARGSE